MVKGLIVLILQGKGGGQGACTFVSSYGVHFCFKKSLCDYFHIRRISKVNIINCCRRYLSLFTNYGGNLDG